MSTRCAARVVRRLAGVALLTVGAIGVLSSGAHRAAADGPGGALASADGVAASVVSPQAPLSDRPVDVSLPSAQAAVDAQGTSVGYAAVPYPGDVVLNGPGLAAGQTGIPVPPYPLYVESSYPAQPTASASQGPVSIQSTSKEGSTSSSATAGLGSGNTSTGRSNSSATAGEADQGVVRAVGEAVTESVTVAGVFRVGRIHSSAEAVRGADGKVTKKSDLEVEGVSIAGQAVSFTPQGIVVAGKPIAQVPQNPLAQILAQQKISVAYLGASETPDSITAPMLEITTVVPVPSLPSPATVTYRFGRATATAGAINLSGLGAGTPADTGSPVADIPGEVPAATPVPPSIGTGLSAPAGSFASPPAAGRSVRPSPPELGRVRRVGAATGLLPGDLGVGFYLVLVVSGALALGGASLFRYVGVRVAWKS